MTCVRGFAGAAAQGPVSEAHAGADSVPVAGVTSTAIGTSIDLPLSFDLSLQVSVLLDDLPVEDGFGNAAAEICLFGDDEALFGWDFHEDETDPRHGFAGSVDDGVEDVLGTRWLRARRSISSRWPMPRAAPPRRQRGRCLPRPSWRRWVWGPRPSSAAVGARARA